MPRANGRPFHLQLRYERQLRGWSQADLAAKVGSEPRTVARWEGGKSLPLPYHRRALCELFNKTAEELGLLSGHNPSLSFPAAEAGEADPSSLGGRENILDGLAWSPNPQKKSYQRLLGFPPPTSARTIQQREQAVQAIYQQLLQAETTAVVLTGIGGVGKSTLAALVYQYAEEQRRASSGMLNAEALWLTITERATMADFMATLFESFAHPLSDWSSLTPQNQALALLTLLNNREERRLIILDQFEHFLDLQTGYTLVDRPGVGEWLDAINSQPCRCRFLLTSRLWPRGTREYPPTYLHDYPVSGLDIREGMDLLQKQGVQAPPRDLRTAVQRCEGHAFSLVLLASLLPIHSIHNSGSATWRATFLIVFLCSSLLPASDTCLSRFLSSVSPWE
jgi:transcriptional regulator with XRE-family HTH domain